MGMTELRDHQRIRPSPLPGSVASSPLYRRWLSAGLWIVPAALALSVATALVVTARQTPIYRSAAVVAVVPGATVPNGLEVFRSLEALQGRTVIATFAQIPSIERIREAAARDVTLRPDSLPSYQTLALVIPNTNLIRIEVEGPDAARAAALANALVKATTAEAKAMYRVFEMTTLASAVPPSEPAAPNPKRAVVLAAILGVFLGVAATYVFARLKTSPVAVV